MNEAADHQNELSRQLTDLHLGMLDAAEAELLEARIASSPQLSAASERCRRLLDQLDAYPAPAVPDALADRILARVAETEAVIPFSAAAASGAASVLPSGTGRELSGSPVLSLRELITIAACITLFVGIFVPGYYRARAIARRNMCRQNMQQIYAGLASYQQANAGFLPQAPAVTGGTWLRARTPGVLRASNTRHPYLLLKEGYVNNPRVFLCPGRDDGIPMMMDNYRRADDFAEAANFNYSIQNNNDRRGLLVDKLPSRMVVLGDANPYFSGRAAHRLDPYGPENSNAHDANAGQNVLYITGEIGWVTRPTVGVDGDHIYRAGTLRHYSGTELPQYETDTFLVP
ncbi:MAG: hypothetical protein JXA69_03755 [Phycisphaerae bacterium]|nr:hypothetical protein [Phycisphaerae bacterium]